MKALSYPAATLLLASALSSGHTAATAQTPAPWAAEIEGPQYFAVLVRDVDASVQWYRQALGLRQLDSSEAEDGSWKIVNLRNQRLLVEIIRDNRAQDVRRARGFFKVGFQVSDVESVADRVAEATGERPRVVEAASHGLRILQLRDPDGNVIQVFSHLGRTPE